MATSSRSIAGRLRRQGCKKCPFCFPLHLSAAAGLRLAVLIPGNNGFGNVIKHSLFCASRYTLSLFPPIKSRLPDLIRDESALRSPFVPVVICRQGPLFSRHLYGSRLSTLESSLTGWMSLCFNKMRVKIVYISQRPYLACRRQIAGTRKKGKNGFQVLLHGL